MSPQIAAALIAGVVSLISLGGTVAVAVVGFRTTRSVTGKTVWEEHVRTLNERFATAAEELGSDKPPAVRLAGVYAMAVLADDWPENRQTCIDVLCAYMRMPYAEDPGDGEARRDFLADREVRHTVIRVVTAHLRDGAPVSWQGRDFDFSGVVFDGGNFVQARFSGGTVNFSRATFPGGTVSFDFAKFSGAEVGFVGAEFSGGNVGFAGTEFSSGFVTFNEARFSGGTVDFGGAEFSGAEVGFLDAVFSGGRVYFAGNDFSGGRVYFTGAEFSGGEVDFRQVGTWLTWLQQPHRPRFDWGDGVPPEGVLLPPESGDTPS